MKMNISEENFKLIKNEINELYTDMTEDKIIEYIEKYKKIYK